MSFSRFIAQRITYRSAQSISRLTVWLALTSIVLGAAIMEVSVSVVFGFEREVQRKIIGFVSDIQIFTYRNPNGELINRIQIDDSAVRALPKRHPEIVAVSAYIKRHTIIKSKESMEGVEARGVGADWHSDFIKGALKEGRLPAFPDSGYGNEILISRKLANLLDLKTNEKVRLYFLEKQKVRVRPVTVSGIYETGLNEFDQAVVFCDFRLLQRILGWESKDVEGFEVHLKDHAQAETMTEVVNGELAFDQRAESVQEQYSELFKWLELQHQNVYFILGLMTLVAVINMSSTILILITERASMIGVFKAMGASDGQIQRIFLWNAFFMIGLGVVLGNILGLGLIAIQEQTHFVMLDQDSYFVKEAPVAWVWGQFALINLGIIVVCTLCMVIPTWIVNYISPIRAIRFE